MSLLALAEVSCYPTAEPTGGDRWLVSFHNLTSLGIVGVAPDKVVTEHLSCFVI